MTVGSVVEVAPGVGVVNESPVQLSMLMENSEFRREISTIEDWVRKRTPNVRAARRNGIFDRDKYAPPPNVVEEMTAALIAGTTDDVVSGWLDNIEALAITDMDLSKAGDDKAHHDLWDQIAEPLRLHELVPQVWRSFHMFSNVYLFKWMASESFTNVGPASSRKAFRNIEIPTAVTLLDPTKVIPVGNFLFGSEELLYGVTHEELDRLEFERRDEGTLASQLFTGVFDRNRFNLDDEQFIDRFSNEGFDSYMVLNPDQVRRFTATRAPYERVASVRMKSIFKLLDMKEQLQAMDRGTLLGSINVLVLVRIGSDQQPAYPQEVKGLRAQMSAGSRSPILVGDHRLNVDIVSPPQDFTLNDSRYDMLDMRITARLYQLLITGAGNTGTRGDDSSKLAKFIARGLQAKRSQMVQFLSEFLFDPVVEANRAVEHSASLEFRPRRIALEFDAHFTNLLADLRDRGDLSRETTLEEIGFDQATEHGRRVFEAENYDDDFETVNPWTSGQRPTTPSQQRRAGRRLGGNNNGGGDNSEPRLEDPDNAES